MVMTGPERVIREHEGMGDGHGIPGYRKALTAVTSAGVPPNRYATSTVSLISASVAPAVGGWRCWPTIRVGCDRIHNHGHQDFILGRDSTVLQDALALRQVRLRELRIALLKGLYPWRDGGLSHIYLLRKHEV